MRRLRALWALSGSQRLGMFLGILIGLWLLSINIFHSRYLSPADGAPLDWLQSTYAVFCLLFFQTPYPLPRDPWVISLYFFLPILGLFVLGRMLVPLARAYLNRREWEKAMASTFEHHVLVCGLGRIGARTIRWLKDLGEPVVGIGLASDTRFLEELRALGVPILEADARQKEVLLQAGLLKASAIVPCTNDDLTNLDIALQAKRLRPEIKVVLRMFDEAVAGNLKSGFNIHTAFSATELSAPAFAAAATRAPIDYAFSFEGPGEKKTLLTISRFTVTPGCALVGKKLEEIERDFDVAVIVYQQGNKTDFHPAGNHRLQAGDHFVVSAELKNLSRLSCVVPATKDLERQRTWGSTTPQP